MRRRRSRQVEIFNFSFLDILACTIGLLIFIMVMVFILQSGSAVADVRAIAGKTDDRARQITLQAQRDAQIAEQLEAQLGEIHANMDPHIVARREAACAVRDAARTIYDEKIKNLGRSQAALQAALHTEEQSTNQKLSEAQTSADAAKARLEASIHALLKAKADAQEAANVRFLPHAQSQEDAARFQIIHLDCRQKEIVLLEISGDGIARELGRSPSDALAGDSDFAKIMASHQQQPRPMVLLWVRPDGMESFERAMQALPEGMERGYEPADGDWKFVGGTAP